MSTGKNVNVGEHEWVSDINLLKMLCLEKLEVYLVMKNILV